MKKTLTCFFGLTLLFIASSCTDPNAEELYELNKNSISTDINGDQSPDMDDNPPPAP